MNVPPQIRCPYTRRPLTEVDESIEHIIPAALGGSAGLSVKADRHANNGLSKTLDQPLAQSSLIGLQRVLHEVQGYRGDPKVRIPGKVKGTSKEVFVTFSGAGATTTVKKPVEMDDSGSFGTITVPADKEEEFVKKLIADHARKGNQVIVERAASLGSEVELDFGFDVLLLKRAMAKVAFLAAVRVLGDSFLDDPLVPEWHRAIFELDPDKARGAKLHGVAFDPTGLLEISAPVIKPHEHLVAVANLQMAGPVVLVALFGKTFHNMVAVCSETSQHGLAVGHGEIAICDSKTGKATFIDYTDFLLARSRGEM